jgi:hypothetical protein
VVARVPLAVTMRCGTPGAPWWTLAGALATALDALDLDIGNSWKFGVGSISNRAANTLAAHTSRTIYRLEASAVIRVAETKRQGHVRRSVWEQITAALAVAGVELLPQGASYGGGVRWTAPREHRQREQSR